LARFELNVLKSMERPREESRCTVTPPWITRRRMSTPWVSGASSTAGAEAMSSPEDMEFMEEERGRESVSCP
jgi:hypothetical protein